LIRARNDTQARHILVDVAPGKIACGLPLLDLWLWDRLETVRAGDARHDGCRDCYRQFCIHCGQILDDHAGDKKKCLFGPTKFRSPLD
jgi:hypothetical protein